MTAVTAEDRKRLQLVEPRLASAIALILQHVNAPGKLPPGVELRVHTGYRPPEEQLAAYRAGNSQLKFGKHNYRPARAVDLVFQRDGRWSWDTMLPWWLVGYWAEACKLAWGGRWGTARALRKIVCRSGMPLGWDCPHCEVS